MDDLEKVKLDSDRSGRSEQTAPPFPKIKVNVGKVSPVVPR